MATRKTSSIKVKCKGLEYFLSLECCNCGYIQKLNGVSDTINDYEDVKDLVKDFMDDGMLCLDCIEGSDND